MNINLLTYNVSKTSISSLSLNLLIVFVIYKVQSARVDLPWSIWAIIQKFHIF